MLAHDIKITSKNPFTGKISRHFRFASVDEVVFILVDQGSRGGARWTIKFATSHLTDNAVRTWETSPHFFRRTAATLTEAKEVMAAACDFGSAAFQQALETWQMLEVRDSGILPYRIVHLSPRHFQAVANDPTGHVGPYSSGGPQWPDGTRQLSGSVILIEAEKYTKAEGSAFSGWLVKTGINSFEGGTSRKSALEQVQLTLADYRDARSRI